MKYKKISTKEKKHILPIKRNTKVIIFFPKSINELVYIFPNSDVHIKLSFLVVLYDLKLLLLLTG